jgi:hypothetical protein
MSMPRRRRGASSYGDPHPFIYALGAIKPNVAGAGIMSKAPRQPKIPKEIEFDFIKSNYFRVIRADGAFGGLSPTGAIHMGIYSERHAIPQKIFHAIQNRQLGPEITSKRQGRKSIVREMEVDVVLEISQALVLRKWLDERIEQYQKLVGPLPPMPNIGEVIAEKSMNGKGKKK